MKKVYVNKILLVIYVIFCVYFILVALPFLLDVLKYVLGERITEAIYETVYMDEEMAFTVFWPCTVVFWIFTVVCAFFYRKTGVVRTIITSVLNLILPVAVASTNQESISVGIIITAFILIAFIVTLITNFKLGKQTQ